MELTLEERAAKANAELTGILARYDLVINTELSFQPSGIFPVVKFGEAKKPMSEDTLETVVEETSAVETTEEVATPEVTEAPAEVAVEAAPEA